MHKDSLGNEGRTVAGDVQVMRAGTGIFHCEFNREDKPTRLFQLWIDMRAPDASPRWASTAFPKANQTGRFATVASGRVGRGGLPIDADACVLGATVRAGEQDRA
ncbi:pirin family protein [Sphingobium sufflavum]|uniref:pirin family protein n=1 Tax=Sphingobium sufflavum TaxID=1129547 RepID=UPI001F1BB394|nr:pirin family protein [Sphingobium sufflavum]MCE7796783.1 pirin family protein [Sphingobium sufflavum]